MDASILSLGMDDGDEVSIISHRSEQQMLRTMSSDGSASNPHNVSSRNEMQAHDENRGDGSLVQQGTISIFNYQNNGFRARGFNNFRNGARNSRYRGARYSNNGRMPSLQSSQAGMGANLGQRITTSHQNNQELTIARMQAELSRLNRAIESKDDELARQQSEVDIVSEQLQVTKESWSSSLRHLQERDSYIEDLTSKKKELQQKQRLGHEKLNQAIRKQQEESFKRLNSAKWIPKDDEEVKNDMDRLKRSMKSVAKHLAAEPSTAAKHTNEANIVATLECVIRWESPEDFLPGMNEKKTPAVILIALLAHHVYERVIGSAFFFSQSPIDNSNPLANLYVSALGGNEKDAHMWRSQTLRLLYLPIGSDNNAGDVALRKETDQKIATIARFHADQFLNGAASLWLDETMHKEAQEKVGDIFLQAGRLSYELWTRRTFLRIGTIKNIAPPFRFNINSAQMEAHALVRYEEHVDQLKGHPVRMMVHPLVLAYGNDEGEEYNQNRVWAPAEVWLPSGDFAKV